MLLDRSNSDAGKNPRTAVSFNDRLLIAQSGKALGEPYREHDPDLPAPPRGT